MKKVFALLLSVLMMFSCVVFTTAAEAEEITDPVYVIVEYKCTDAVYPALGTKLIETSTSEPLVVQRGTTPDAARVKVWLKDVMPEKFEYEYAVTENKVERMETRTYEFKYFTRKGDEGKTPYYYKNMGAIEDDTVVFVAEYKITDTIDHQTFWEFVESIFARINIIFEYFAEIFGF